MSHVVSMKLSVKDLEALQDCAPELGMEMVRQDQFNWFGTYVGDTPLPEGFTKEDMGKCLYALRIKGQPSAYEVGVVESRTNPGTYELLWDFWQGGYGLENAIGKDGNKLRQAYSTKVTEKQLRRQGLRVTKSITADGKVVLRGRR